MTICDLNGEIMTNTVCDKPSNDHVEEGAKGKVDKTEGHDRAQLLEENEETNNSSHGVEIVKEILDSAIESAMTKMCDESEEARPDVGIDEDENLLDSEGWIDVLGSGRLRLKITEPVSHEGDYSKITMGCWARITLTGRFENEIVEAETEYEVIVGDNDVIRSLDLVLPCLREHERAKFITDPEFAYGNVGLKSSGIPPNCALEYEVHVSEVKLDFSIHSLPHDEKMRMGRVKKSRGNFWFSRCQFENAVHIYRRVVEYFDCEELDLTSPIEKCLLQEHHQVLIEERSNALNNLAISQIKLEAWLPALATLNRLLKTEPTNEKGLYRKAKVLLERGLVDEPITILRRLVKLYPANEQATLLLNKLVKKQKASFDREADISRRMLGLPKTPNHSVNNRKRKYNWLTPSNWSNSTMAYVCVGACVTGAILGVSLASLKT